MQSYSLQISPLAGLCVREPIMAAWRDSDDPGDLGGCKVLVISGDPALRRSIMGAISGLGVATRQYADVESARADTARHPPQAIIYDGRLDSAAAFTLRHELCESSFVVFVEVFPAGGGLQVTQLGAVQARKVERPALHGALIHALVSELGRLN